jgi:hypothetical protein
MKQLIESPSPSMAQAIIGWGDPAPNSVYALGLKFDLNP